MTAAPADQQRLLDLADLDLRLAGLAHRRTHLPEQAALDELVARRREATGSAARVRIAVEDLDRAIAKLGSDVDAVRRRLERGRSSLAAGGLAPREASELEHESATLARRQAELEAEQAELGARRAALAADLDHSGATVSDLDGRLAGATEARDRALAELEDSATAAEAERARLTEGVPAALLDLYGRQVADGGVGAGRLSGDRCTACSMFLGRSFAARAAAAPADEVMRCPECGAVLVRSDAAR